MTYIVKNPEQDQTDTEEDQTDTDTEIDVDIGVYDDDCESERSDLCEEIPFSNDEDDGDDTFDFE